MEDNKFLLNEADKRVLKELKRLDWAHIKNATGGRQIACRSAYPYVGKRPQKP